MVAGWGGLMRKGEEKEGKGKKGRGKGMRSGLGAGREEKMEKKELEWKIKSKDI